MARQGMIQKVRSFVEAQREPWVWVAMSGGILVLDYFTNPFVQFPVTFLFPVILAGWHRDFRWAARFATILPLIRIGYTLQSEIPYGPLLAVVNFLVRAAVLMILGYLVAKVSRQRRKLEREVKALQGILPTCAVCKDIRDEHGNWHRIEVFISANSNAKFSHGFCPDCFTKQYGAELEPHELEAVLKASQPPALKQKTLAED